MSIWFVADPTGFFNGQKHLLLPAFTCFYLLYLAFLIMAKLQLMSFTATFVGGWFHILKVKPVPVGLKKT